MTIDKEKLKDLARAVKPGHYMTPEPYEEDRRYSPEEIASLEFSAAASPEVILALLAEIERVTKRLCVCRDCGGQGEVYSGHDSYQGWHQPPEPEMDVCGACGGDGVLGPMEDFEALAGERDQLKAENEALRKQNEELPKTIHAQLEAFLGETKRDAERYRWLRNVESDVAIMFGGHGWEEMSHEYMDQAIDSVMAKEKGQ